MQQSLPKKSCASYPTRSMTGCISILNKKNISKCHWKVERLLLSQLGAKGMSLKRRSLRIRQDNPENQLNTKSLSTWFSEAKDTPKACFGNLHLAKLSL